MKALDAVQLEVIRNALVAAAEEMGVTIWRTSRSSVVRDLLDYSTCMFDSEGLSVAQATCIPVHLNSMSSCLTDIIEKHIPLSDWHEGDIIITNDPYAGGQHLNDVLTFKPTFVDGELVGIAGVLVHHPRCRRRCAGELLRGRDGDLSGGIPHSADEARRARAAE